MLPLAISIFAAALVLLALAIRGRTIARGRFCRKCRFDLAGFESVDIELRCSECGTLHGPQMSPRSVLRRTSRPGVALGMTGLILGAGLAWLSLVQPVSWYPHLPEPVLLGLDAMGVDEAFDDAHARLVAGTLSQHGFHRLINRSMKLVEEPKAGWDPRRGDVLALAMQQGLLNETQVIEIAERSLLVRLEIRPQLSLDAAMVRYRFVIEGNPNTASAMAAAGRLRSPYQIEINRAVPSLDSRPQRFTFPAGGGSLSPVDWLPSDAVLWDVVAGTFLKQDAPKADSIHEEFSFMLRRNGSEIHRWTRAISGSFERVDSPAPMTTSAFVQDHDGSARRDFAESLSIAWVQVPIRREEGRAQRGTEDCYWSRTIRVGTMRSRPPSDASMLFDLFIRSNGEEVYFGSFHGAFRHGMDIRRDGGLERNMLDYFDRHSGFWQTAVENGTVDVVLRSNEALAAEDPRYTQHADVSVIFHDVPLMVLIPEDTGKPSPAGTTWEWIQQNQKSYQAISGQLMED